MTTENRRIHEPEEYLTAMPGCVYRAVPLGKAPFEVSWTYIRLEQSALWVGHCSPFIGRVGLDGEKAIINVPLDNAQALLHDGHIARQTVGVYGAGAELLRANPLPSTHASIFLNQASAEALLEPGLGRSPFHDGPQTVLRPLAPTLERAARIFRAAASVALEAPRTFEHGEPRRALSDAVLMIAGALAAGNEDSGPKAPTRISRTRKRIILGADDFLLANLDRPIYTADLCAALGCSGSSLTDAFRAVFFVTPHEYLKRRRLALVRARLTAREGPQPLVKTVALAHGFWHLGQFGRDYRAVYNELPSATLNRARGRQADEGRDE